MLLIKVLLIKKRVVAYKRGEINREKLFSCEICGNSWKIRKNLWKIRTKSSKTWFWNLALWWENLDIDIVTQKREKGEFRSLGTVGVSVCVYLVHFGKIPLK